MNQIYNEIKMTTEAILKTKLTNPIPIHYGHLNLKWIVSTNNQKLFIKQLNKQRYNEKKLEKINQAMSIQKQLNHYGIKCPNLFSNCDQYLIESSNGEYFVITEHVEGCVLDYGKINKNQIFDLGRSLGQLHTTLKKFKQEPARWVIPSMDQLINDNKTLLKESNQKELDELLYKQRQILNNIHLDDFNIFEIGWTHADLWTHNVLFTEKELTAILDFDRLQVSYPALDIARSILSFALKDNSIHPTLIDSFIEGYNTFNRLTKKELYLSLKLLWLLESF